MFSLKNKFHDRKESSLTKYYRIRSKLTVFEKCLTLSFKDIKLIEAFIHPEVLIDNLCKQD